MASGRQRHCLFCKSAKHRTRNCASQVDLIDFDEPKPNREFMAFREDASTRNAAAIDTTAPPDNQHSFSPSVASQYTSASPDIGEQGKMTATKDEASHTRSPEIQTTTYDHEATQKDSREAIRNSTQGQELMKLSSSTTVAPLSSSTNIPLELPEPQDMLSEDEGDVHTLKTNSLTKVLSWNDGSKKLVAKHAVVRRVQEEHTDEMVGQGNSQASVKESQGTQPMPQTIQPFKKDPLKGMVPIESTKESCDTPTTSFLALSGGRQCREAVEKSQACGRSYSEAVTRTPNAEAGTVTVSSLPRKRRGKRGQASYFDITSELHYLR